MNIKEQFDECGMTDKPCQFTVEESYLPMSDGTRLYMMIYKPETCGSFPIGKTGRLHLTRQKNIF